MVAKRGTKPSTGKKLKVKKETLKDLGTKNAGRVKGGVGVIASQLCHHKGG